ncbi:MAG: metallophosphoesterase family protein [Microcoleaceae cyanobacterium]
MVLKRRQILMLAGGSLGLGMAVSLGQLLSQSSRQRTAEDSIEPTAPVEPTPDPSPTPIAIAPAGMFAPVRGDVRLVVMSDLNSRYGSTTYESQVGQAISLIPDWQPDLVLCAGDMVAGQKVSLSASNIQAMWEGFDRVVAEPLRQLAMPFAITMGNHDASGNVDSSGGFIFQQERELAQAYWDDPRHDLHLEFLNKASFPFVYSFRQNEIFYLIWDGSSYQMPIQQIQTLEAQLASEPAQSAKLRIVMGHLPLYAVSPARDKPGEVLQSASELQQLLETYQVHVYVSGHHHAYFPGHRDQLKLLFSGALGSGPRPLINSDLEPRHTLTVVDINLEQQTSRYTTYDMKTLAMIKPDNLPQKIVGTQGWVLREEA